MFQVKQGIISQCIQAEINGKDLILNRKSQWLRIYPSPFFRCDQLSVHPSLIHKQDFQPNLSSSSQRQPLVTDNCHKCPTNQDVQKRTEDLCILHTLPLIQYVSVHHYSREMQAFSESSFVFQVFPVLSSLKTGELRNYTVHPQPSCFLSNFSFSPCAAR